MHQCCKSRVNLFRIRSQHFAYLDPDPVPDPTVTMYKNNLFCSQWALFFSDSVCHYWLTLRFSKLGKMLFSCSGLVLSWLSLRILCVSLPSLSSGRPSLSSGRPSLSSGRPSLSSGRPSLSSGLAANLGSLAPVGRLIFSRAWIRLALRDPRLKNVDNINSFWKRELSSTVYSKSTG